MNCRICGNKENNTEYDVLEMMYGTKELFQYFQCAKCDCLQITEIPSDISKYYPEDYYSYSTFDENTRKKYGKLKSYMISYRNKYAAFGKGLIGRFLCKKYPTDKFKGISKLRLSKNSTILDVGCGAGDFLCACSEMGFKNLLGVDPFNANDIEYKNGLKILKKEIYDVDGQWDLITFHHSFEHVPDQIKILQHAYEIIKPGGRCIIRIPTVSSYAWEHYGVKWVQLDAPRHFYLHSIESMVVLAKKTGMKLTDIMYDSTPFQFWGSEQYENDIPLRDESSYAVNPEKSMFSKKDILDFTVRAQALNDAKQGDQAIFYLRKPLK